MQSKPSATKQRPSTAVSELAQSHVLVLATQVDPTGVAHSHTEEPGRGAWLPSPQGVQPSPAGFPSSPKNPGKQAHAPPTPLPSGWLLTGHSSSGPSKQMPVVGSHEPLAQSESAVHPW